MGYQTDYKLSFNVENYEAVMEEIQEISGYTFESDGRLYGMKWYDHDEDMKKLSKNHPNVLFELSVEGDIWIKYFKNGKMQEVRGVITFEPFDESKMK